MHSFDFKDCQLITFTKNKKKKNSSMHVHVDCPYSSFFLSLAMANLGQQRLNNTVPVAVGISVAVTFVICFFVAVVVIFLLTKSWKKKQLVDDDNHSSASQFSQVPMKRLNSLSNKKDKTELMDKTYSSLPVAHDKNRNWSPTSSPRHELASFYEQKSLPAIKIQESSPASKSLGVTDLKPLKKTRLPALNLNSPRPISPMFLPRRKQTVSPSPSSSMRNSPEGSENGRPSSVGGPSWFPAEEVQYNV